MSTWRLVYEGFDPERERLREALLTLGNGYMATRGAAAESVADGVHYPGTYLAGGYNRLVSRVGGRTVENEDLVNFPNWTSFTFRIGDGDWFDLGSVEVLSYRQELDLYRGLLEREVRFADRGGRLCRFVTHRFVSMHDMHLAAQWTALTAENWSGPVTLRTALDGRVWNAGVARYRDLEGRHLVPLEARVLGDDGLFLLVETSQSHLRVAQAARTLFLRDGEVVTPPRTALEEEGYVAQEVAFDLAPGVTVAAEKVVSLYTSRDRAISEPGLAARTTTARAGRYAALLSRHMLAWRHLWRRYDLQVDFRAGEGRGEQRDGWGKHSPLLVLRLHIFHLLQTVSPHTIDLDVGVPARGLHGEAYRGHVFWDELFLFPFLNLRSPVLSRALLRYRYRRLNEARAAARAAGFRGAMFPWQSGSDGREESQRIHLNPLSGRWIPDNSHLQRHINSAIAYNIWSYYQVTSDLEFLYAYGAEMLLEIARFWASVATYDPESDRYEIAGVVGPDEYHDAYVGADRPGLRNNAYTNVMAAWVLCRAREVLDLLPAERRRELCESLALSPGEIAHWDLLSRKLRVVFHDDGIISQFEGYGDLLELDLEALRRRYGNISRLDRILEAERDTPNRYKVSKQADVLMLFYLLSADEIEELFRRLGYPFDRDSIPRNVEYYLQRTTHGSTLSRVVHSWVTARSQRPRSFDLFCQALESDVADIQQGTTAEGIHLGAMAGTVDLMARGYTGIETRGGVLRFNPSLPDEVPRLRLSLRYRRHRLEVDVTHRKLVVRSRPVVADPIDVAYRNEVHRLEAGGTLEFSLKRSPRAKPGGPTGE